MKDRGGLGVDGKLRSGYSSFGHMSFASADSDIKNVFFMVKTIDTVLFKGQLQLDRQKTTARPTDKMIF